MSFHDVQFPEYIERAVVGGTGFKTRVLAFEPRNIDWSQISRSRWQLLGQTSDILSRAITGNN